MAQSSAERIADLRFDKSLKEPMQWEWETYGDKIYTALPLKKNIKNAFVDGPFGSNLKSEHYIENGDVYVVESGFMTTGIFTRKESGVRPMLKKSRSICFPKFSGYFRSILQLFIQDANNTNETWQALLQNIRG
jgi:hypothetical protein